MGRKVRRKDERVLYALSGCKCAICNEFVIEKRSDGEWMHFSEIHHIRGISEKALFLDETMTDEEINHESNLIVLCSNCHKKVHRNKVDYTVERVLRIKEQHENLVLSWSAGETDPEKLLESVPMDIDISILHPTRPNTSGVCEVESKDRQAALWLWVETHYDEKCLIESSRRIEEYFGGHCCVKAFEFGPYLMRTPPNLKPVLFGFTSVEFRSTTQLVEEQHPVKDGRVFQFNLPLRDQDRLPWLLRGLMKRLRAGKQNEVEPSDIIRKGWLIVPSLKKPGLRFRLVPTNPEGFPTFDVSDRRITIEELLAPDGNLVVSLRFSSPIGSHDFFWQIVGPATVESDGYKSGQLLVDAGWNGGDTVLRFWIPEFPDPDDCVHDCTDCPLLGEECFEPHYFSHSDVDDLYSDSKHVAVYLSEPEKSVVKDIIRKAATDIHKRSVTDEEEAQLEGLLEKANELHDKALEHLKDIESYLRSQPLNSSQKKAAIRPIEVVKHWISRKGKYALPPEVYEHKGPLTEEDLESISESLSIS